MVGVEPAQPVLAITEDQHDRPLVAPQDLALVPRLPSAHVVPLPDLPRPVRGGDREPSASGGGVREHDAAYLFVREQRLWGDVPSALAWQL
jgi:hypothetical protein